MAAQQIKSARCHLLDSSPPEVQSMIWKYALTDEYPIKVWSGQTDHPDDVLWEPPALLTVCRRIRNEATSIYFSENAFEFNEDDPSSPQAIKWLKNVAKRGFLACIKHVFLLDATLDDEELQSGMLCESYCIALNFLEDAEHAVGQKLDANIFIIYAETRGATGEFLGDEFISIAELKKMCDPIIAGGFPHWW